MTRVHPHHFPIDYRAMLRRHIRALRSQGKTAKQISRMLGVAQSSVSRIGAEVRLFRTVTRVLEDGSAWIVRM